MPFDESTTLGKRVLYLRSRGYDIGEEVAAKKVSGEVDQVCVAVGNTRDTEQQIERLVFYESCKDEDAKVDGLGLQYMAQDWPQNLKTPVSCLPFGR